jgi:hypothetical protein
MLIKESLSKDIIDLKNYLSGGDDESRFYEIINIELHEFTNYIKKRTKNKKLLDKLKNIEHFYDYDMMYDLIDKMKIKNNSFYKSMVENIMRMTYNKSLLYMYYEDYPSWVYFDNSPELIRNTWCVHFTNDAAGIVKNGFKYGVSDYSKLGLTTLMDDDDKKYGGYNFAYTVYDFDKYYRRNNDFKYGEEIVIFIASGLKVWHYGDEEPQVIFLGKDAKNIVQIHRDRDERFIIYNKKTNRELIKSDYLLEVAQWITNNYNQYKNVI